MAERLTDAEKQRRAEDRAVEKAAEDRYARDIKLRRGGAGAYADGSCGQCGRFGACACFAMSADEWADFDDDVYDDDRITVDALIDDEVAA